MYLIWYHASQDCTVSGFHMLVFHNHSAYLQSAFEKWRQENLKFGDHPQHYSKILSPKPKEAKYKTKVETDKLHQVDIIISM